MSTISTPTKEVKLLKDDNWKLIQQNTFTRWVNQQLKQAVESPQIENLQTDFADGIVLIKLAEVLSGRTMPRYNKKANMRTQKLDNVSLVLNFFQKEEGIKIVNIDSSHIVDQNLKLILGLVWTLILHYSLSHQQFSVDGDVKTSESDKKETPKQRLLAWIQAKLPHHPINNFTSNWNDGILLGALVDACLGGRFAEWANWKPADALENTQRAMQAAEQALGVETLITPEELTNPNVDEKSVMTYLAQFPRAQPQLLGQIYDLDRHPLIHSSTSFTVQFEKENLVPEVNVLDPRGQAAKSAINFSKDDPPSKYTVTFTPELVGEHKIQLFARDSQDPYASILPVDFASIHAIPAPEIVGLGQIAVMGVHRRFQIGNVSDYQKLDVSAVDPEGKEILLDSSSERDENTVTCCYTPKVVGKHAINVLYNKRHIPGSPFTLDVTDEADPNEQKEEEPPIPSKHEPLITRIPSPPSPLQNYKNVTIWGRGVLPKGTCAGEELAIHVDNCPDPVQVEVKKDDLMIPVAPKWKYGEKQSVFAQPFGALHPRQSFTFMPRTSGKYEVTVKANNGIQLDKSPYKVMVGPKNSSSVSAAGPGLEGGVVGQRAVFYVDTQGCTNQLEFAIEGPSKTDIHCEDNRDGSAIVEYTPEESGQYAIKISELETEAHIRGSPFILWIDPDSTIPLPQARRPVNVPLPEKQNAQIGQLFDFTIPNSVEAEMLDIDVYDPDLNKLEVTSRKGPRGHYYSFTPEKEGKHVISIVADKVAVEGWPIYVSVTKPYATASKATTPTENVAKSFGQLTTETRNVPVQINFEDSPEIIRNGSSTYNKFSNDDTDGTPHVLKYQPGLKENGCYDVLTKQQQHDGDARLVRVEGEGLKRFVPNELTEFVVDTSATEVNTLFVGVVTSHGPTEELNVRHTGNGKYKVTYTAPYNSETKVFVKYGEAQVPGSPFSVRPVQHNGKET